MLEPKKPFERGSASSIRLFRECRRKWYITYALGHRAPETPDQALGKAVHAVGEAYSRVGGTLPDSRPGEIFSQGVHLLPAPGTGQVEGEMWLHETDPPLLGYIDLLYEDEGGVVVCDLKTTKSRRWMKSPHELALDVQMITYARYVLTKVHPDAQSVSLEHVYFGTRKPFSDKVRIEVSRDTVSRVWEEIKSEIPKMVECHSGDENDAPQNLSMCDAYGGCPFRGRCLGGAPTKENTMSGRLIDEILARNSKSPESPESNPESPKPPKSLESPESNPESPESPKGKDSGVNLQAINPPDEKVTLPSRPAAPSPGVPATAPAPRGAPPVSPSDGPKFLFIGCLPSKDRESFLGGCLMYSDYIRSFTAQICEQFDVPHISFAGSYNDGYKHLASLVANAGWPDSHRAIYVSPMRSKGCEHVLDILTALADVVIERP